MRAKSVPILSLLLAGATARTVTLPLTSRASQYDARGDPRFRLPSPHRSLNASSKVDVPVTDWFNRTDNQWYTTFSIGTPPQNLTVLFDTGSADLLLPESNCTTCGDLTLFNPNMSSTFSPLPGTYVSYLFSTGADSIPFTQPEGATCRFVHDTVALGTGDLEINNQVFVLCDSFAEALDVSGISGIMGMSLLISTEGGNITSWYWNLVADGQLDSPLYSFYIPPGEVHGGEVTLGGIDDSKVDGDIIYIDLDANMAETTESYTVDQFAIYSNGDILVNTSSNGTVAPLPFGWAILDTGTAFMQTPDYDTAANIYAQISPRITQIDPAGAWGAPCDEMDQLAPDLTFTFGTADKALNLTIPKEYFSLGEYPGQAGICQAVFNNPVESLDSQWFSDGTAIWLVGSPLLKQYYTVWDGVGLRLGWGKLAGAGHPGF